MDESDLEPRRRPPQPKDLTLLGIAELEAYIAQQAKAGAIKDPSKAPTYQRLVDPTIWRDAMALVDKK